MNDLNRVTLIGRTTRDVELKYLQSGTAVASFSIANNRKYNDKEEVSYFDCIAWGKLGEVLAQYCQKGKQIAVEGRLQQNRWEKDGSKHSKVEIIADNVQFLDSKKSEATPDHLFDGAKEVPENPFDDSLDIPF